MTNASCVGGIAARWAVLVPCLMAASCGPSMSTQQPFGVRQVESYLTDLTRRSTIPGIQYLVVTPTRVLFEHASGWADIHRQVPIKSTTTMMAYSMSKTFTAVAILQLVEAGRVGLDNPVAQYVDALWRASHRPATHLPHVRHPESDSLAMGSPSGAPQQFRRTDRTRDCTPGSSEPIV